MFRERDDVHGLEEYPEGGLEDDGKDRSLDVLSNVFQELLKESRTFGHRPKAGDGCQTVGTVARRGRLEGWVSICFVHSNRQSRIESIHDFLD
jgi:hypothetical protein